MNLSNGADLTCFTSPDEHRFEKFYLVAVFGSSVAMISFFSNVMLFYLFVSRPHFRTSNLFFMTILAFFDIFVALSYICIMSVGVIKEMHTDTYWIWAMWYGYLRPLYTCSRIAKGGSTFLIVSATIERFVAAVRWSEIVLSPRQRLIAASIPISLAILLYGSVFFEMKVQIVRPYCSNYARFGIARSELIKNYYYSAVFTFWTRKIVGVFLPFFALVFMNTVIVKKLRQQQELDLTRAVVVMSIAMGNNSFSNHSCETRGSHNMASVRAATRMLALVVCTYLLTQTPSFLISTWEFLSYETLSKDYANLYTFSTDICSILTVSMGAARLPTYCLCNHKIYEELKKMWSCGYFSTPKDQDLAVEHERRCSLIVPLFPNSSSGHSSIVTNSVGYPDEAHKCTTEFQDPYGGTFVTCNRTSLIPENSKDETVLKMLSEDNDQEEIMV